MYDQINKVWLIWQFDYASQLTQPKQPNKHAASFFDIHVVPLMHDRQVLIRVDDILHNEALPVGIDEVPAELQLCSPLILL